MRILSLFLLCTIQLVVGCGDNSDSGTMEPEAAIALTLNNLEFNVDGTADEGVNYITVTCKEKWDLTEGDQAWCRATVSNGTTVSFTVDENTTTESRTATFLFYCISDIKKSTKLTITQEQCNLIKPEYMAYSIPLEGGLVKIGVDANIDFRTIIPSECMDWMSLESTLDSKSLVESQIVVKVTPFSGGMRAGKIVLESDKFDDVTITITQSNIDMNKLSVQASNDLIKTTLATRRQESLSKFGSEWNNKELENDGYKMKFYYKIFGAKPEDGRALYISMHGGGGTSVEANNEQWNNQKGLYEPTEGVYFAPRSPTDTWDMWHQGYMDGFIEKIIELAVIKEDVNPNKVYIMGYSAGGDGTYQLAPRMSDIWAGAAMSAGHPGDAKIENLRNLPFAIYMGGNDSAYDRNKLAREWGTKFDQLLASDSGGYVHDVQIYSGVGHWMELRDNVSMKWLPKFERNAIPTKVVWIQDDVIRNNFYWLEATSEGKKRGAKVVATYNTDLGEVRIEECTKGSVIIGLNDKMVNLENPVKVFFKGEEVFNDILPRTAGNIDSSVAKMRDAGLVFPSRLRINSDGTAIILTN